MESSFESSRGQPGFAFALAVLESPSVSPVFVSVRGGSFAINIIGSVSPLLVVKLTQFFAKRSIVSLDRCHQLEKSHIWYQSERTGIYYCVSSVLRILCADSRLFLVACLVRPWLVLPSIEGAHSGRFVRENSLVHSQPRLIYLCSCRVQRLEAGGYNVDIRLTWPGKNLGIAWGRCPTFAPNPYCR